MAVENTQVKGQPELATAYEEWLRKNPALTNNSDPNGERRTQSGHLVRAVYTPLDSGVTEANYLDKLGLPGEYPFTRGPYPSMYRGRLWTRRQVVGVGTAKETNVRHQFVLSKGQTGLSNDFDLPTLIGLDSDHPEAQHEVGRMGVAIDALPDMHDLLEGIPLEETSISFTINHPAVTILGMFLALAEKQGASLARLSGTIQNDPLKEFFAQKTFVFPPRPSLRLMADIVEFCTRFLPRWNPVSVCGYHTRDSGSTVEQELAFTLAAGIEYVQTLVERGLDVDSFAPRVTFLFYVHNDFFEEIAKFRAARRLWAHIMKERFGAAKAESCRLRVHVQTGGATLTAQQPENNLVRGTVQALAAILGGVQSMAVSTYDEALAIPSERSQRLSLRLQQILAHESGVTNTVDPLGGSYFVEALTDTLEAEALRWMQKIEDAGGLTRCVETGLVEKFISEEAYSQQLDVQTRKRIVVGVNDYCEAADDASIELFRVNPGAEEAQVRRLRQLRAERNQSEVDRCLRKVGEAARGNANLVPPVLEAVKTLATEGEVMDVLRAEFGVHRPPAIF